MGKEIELKYLVDHAKWLQTIKSVGEFFRQGHPQNRFLKIIATITNSKLPINYYDKKSLLLKSRIGLWDVAYQAIRQGSLDSAIKNEVPNDLENFIANHKTITTIGFNGKKSEALFDKYFNRQERINYVLLPSTSPANAGINFENCGKLWRQIFDK